ncbi:MAG: hypothetical protein ACOZAK_01300 [Patescibacteria group bacterium]
MEKFINITKNISSADWWQQKIEQSIQDQPKDNWNLLSRIAIDKLKNRHQPEQEQAPEFEAQFNQWKLVIEADHYKLANPDETGDIDRFYAMENGKYGEPIITAEPTLAFALPEGVSFTDVKGTQIAKPEMKIAGVICQNADGSVAHRFSLSGKGERVIEQTEDGLLINGERWYLKTLFSKDKNRIKNYDAYYVLEKPATVEVSELQDINFVASGEFIDQEKPESWQELLKDSTDLKRLAKQLHKRLKRKFEALDPENRPKAEYKVNQWTFKVWEDKYEIVNLAPEGIEVFYKVIKGKYGEPIIVAEPDKAFAVPDKETFVNVKGEEIARPPEDISGIICQEEDGSVAHRFSLSNPKTPQFKVTKDGLVLFLKDEAGKVTKERWYLHTLFAKDSKRVKNYDGYYSRRKPKQIKMLELQDLDFSKKTN